MFNPNLEILRVLIAAKCVVFLCACVYVCVHVLYLNCTDEQFFNSLYIIIEIEYGNNFTAFFHDI